MSMFAGDRSEAWSVLHQQLLDFLNLPAEQLGVGVQPLAVAARAEWDTGNTRLNVFHQQQVANAVPTWTPLYERAGGGAKNVPDEYRAFLDRLNSKIIADTPQIDGRKLEQLSREREELLREMAQFNEDTRRRYTEYAVSTPPPARLSRNEWERKYGYSGQRENLVGRLDYLNGLYLQEVNTAGGELLEIGRAISELGAENQRIALPSNEFELELGEDTWSYYYKSYVAGNLKHFLGEAAARTFAIDSASRRSTSFESRWRVSAGASWFGLFTASGAAENVEVQRSWENTSTSVSVTFANVQRFDVVRGPWFKAGLLDQFRDRLPGEFWGPGGRLNLIPSAVVLAHGLTVSVKGSREAGTYLYEYKRRAGGGGFRIGPFGFGGRGSSTTSLEQTTVEVNSDGFTVQDRSGRAMILAVVSSRPLDVYTGNEVPLHVRLMARERPHDGAARPDRLTRDLLGI